MRGWQLQALARQSKRGPAVAKPKSENGLSFGLLAVRPS